MAAIRKILSSFWCKTFILACFVQLTFYVILAYFFLYPDPIQTYHRGWQLVDDEFDGSDRGNWHNIWNGFEHIYDKRIKSEADAVRCLKEALCSLNEPHTGLQYFANPAQTFDYIYSDFNSQYYGCGLQLEPAEIKEPISRYVTYPKLRTVLPGSPAEKCGLLRGDEILSIDSKSTFRQPVEILWNRFHGTGTGSVCFEVRRKGKVSLVKLERGPFQFPTLSSKLLPGEIGYIRLSSFMQWGLSDLVEKALLDLKDSRALILDLRDNPGGTVGNAIEVCSLFMKSGTICIEEKRDFASYPDKIEHREIELYAAEHAWRPRHVSTATAETLKKPLVILINERSASAAEMVTAALRETRGSQFFYTLGLSDVTLIGKQSYGKGVGQSCCVISGTVVMSVRSMHWKTPNGNWVGDAHINRIGIKPDIEVAMNKEGTEFGSADDNQLETAREFLCTYSRKSNGK